MTARQLLHALRQAGLTLDGSGPTLKVSPAKAIPPHLRPHLLRLHTGVRALLRGANWYGIDKHGHGTGSGPDGRLSFDRELPEGTVRLAVGGDPPGCWDRIRKNAPAAEQPMVDGQADSEAA